MPKTQRAFDSNTKKLSKRSTSGRKKKEPIVPKYARKKDLFPHASFPIYLEPTKKDSFNKSWFRDVDDAIKQINRLNLKPTDYRLLQYYDQKERKTKSTS